MVSTRLKNTTTTTLTGDHSLITSIIKTLTSINLNPKSPPPLNPTKTPLNIPQLSEFTPHLNPNLVIKIVKSRLTPHHSLLFFNWASFVSPNYAHNRLCYIAMYETLLSQRCLTTAEKFIELHGLADDGTFSMMIRAYASVGNLRGAIHVFYKAKVSVPGGDCNLSWHSLLAVLIRSNKVGLIRGMFDKVVQEGFITLNVVSYTMVIKAYCKVGLVDDARKVFDEMPVTPSVVTYGVLVGGYCRNGMMREARDILDKMVTRGEGFEPNLVIYTTLIDGYCKKGEMEEAVSCFDEMVCQGIEPGLFTYNTIINGFCLLGKVDEAVKMLSKMRSKGVRDDLVTHTSLLRGLINAGRLDDALKHLRDMISFGLKADIKAYGVVLIECCKSKSGKPVEAVNLLGEMIGNGIRPGIGLFNEVLKSLVKRQAINEAVLLLKRMPILGENPNYVSYLTVISSLSEIQGRAEEVEGLLGCMIRSPNKPDAAIYSRILKMYCNGGDLDKATQVYYDCLNKGYAVNIDSFAVFMDKLCAKGLILKAEEHIQDMAKRGFVTHLDNYKSVLNELTDKYKKPSD